jgi:glycine C-acetyltransferase
MPKTNFIQKLSQEINRIDGIKTSKRREKLIEGFTDHSAPRAIIDGKEFQIFNSNDYLGLRHHPLLKAAEHESSAKLGTGPGAVRFISGSFAIHRQLEKALAKFHGRDDAIVFSSAFAANLATIFSLIKGQAKDSLIDDQVLVISDELNHRSIIDGIRLAGLTKEQKQIFQHLNSDSLESIIKENLGKFDRVVIITDGIFSMLGEHQDLSAIKQVVDKYDSKFTNGILLIVDDCHGIAAFGPTGRGVEEVSNTQADVLVGTLGKGLGADGGYVAADQVIIDYLRESAATYIYSNSISPGTAAAALAAVQILDSNEGTQLLQQLQKNIQTFKQAICKTRLKLASQSSHPIQPLLIGDPTASQALTQELFARGYLVTSINYPVVAKSKDEIRVQLAATQNTQEIIEFVNVINQSAKKIELF